MDPVWCESPNFGERRGGAQPGYIVLHYTAMASATGARDWLCNPESEVSAHYLIGRDGVVWQMVRDQDRAWHAGAGAWGGLDDLNSHSIGIELDNDGATPFSAPLMNSLEGLLFALQKRWAIPAHRVIGHSDMAIGRKIDPGTRFDWRRLALQGLSIWPKPDLTRKDAPDQFFDAARRFGYRHDDPAAVLRAFRLRFAPWRSGPVCGADCAEIADLAARFPA